MESLSLIDSFQEFKEFKDIDRATLMNILESVFRSTIKRRFGDDENIENEIIKKSVFLRDAAINTMMGNTRAEANSEKIRRELKRELNKNLRCGEIEEVYFNKFIIQ